MFGLRYGVPLALSGAMLLVLTQFQNCASLPSRARAASNPPSEFSFSQNRIEVYDEASSVALSGKCDSQIEGANLQWSLLSNEGSKDAMVTGEATCVHGMFQFQVTLKDDMVCGLDHVVRVQSPMGAPVESSLVRRCQPLASQKLPGQCELEFNLKSDGSGGRVCERVCYTSNRLVSSELRLESECASLASTLAGP